jgi:hypothetical protein
MPARPRQHDDGRDTMTTPQPQGPGIVYRAVI